MSRWLLKTEPGSYSWNDLVRDKRAVWDGVTNATALKNIRTMKKGDLAFIYHTGDERAAIGIAELTRGPYPDPKADNDKIVVIDIKPKQPLGRPVTLHEIKADKSFQGWDLLRIGRLSVVPVQFPMWERIIQLSKERA